MKPQAFKTKGPSLRIALDRGGRLARCLRSLVHPIMDPNKANIIVTGSSGRIGSPLSTMLGDAYNVVGFDRAGPPYPPIEVECVSVDLTSDDRIRRALARVRYAYG